MRFHISWIPAILTCMLIAITAALASPIYEPGTDRTVTFTNTTISVTTSSVTTTLAAPSRHIVIKTSTGANIIYVRLDGTAATTANFQIDPGGSLVLDPLPVVSSVSIIGAGTSGTYSILAW